MVAFFQMVIYFNSLNKLLGASSLINSSSLFHAANLCESKVISKTLRKVQHILLRQFLQEHCFFLYVFLPLSKSNSDKRVRKLPEN